MPQKCVLSWPSFKKGGGCILNENHALSAMLTPAACAWDRSFHEETEEQVPEEKVPEEKVHLIQGESLVCPVVVH